MSRPFDFIFITDAIATTVERAGKKGGKKEEKEKKKTSTTPVYGKKERECVSIFQSERVTKHQIYLFNAAASLLCVNRGNISIRQRDGPLLLLFCLATPPQRRRRRSVLE